MGISLPSLPRGYRYPSSQALTSFAGGINRRDQDSELGPNDVIDSWNVTYDERGGAVSRLGYAKYNGSAYGTDMVQNTFWSAIAADMLVNAGTKLYLGTSNTVRHTFTTSERVTFTELATFIVASHPTDGMFTSTNGTTWTTVGQIGTVTVTVAAPGVFTSTAHGLVAGDQVSFTTTGALPTGIVAGTIYFVIATGLTANAFEVSATSGGSAVTTSGTQSGVHTVYHGGAPKGTCVATWQNKLWVGLTNGSLQWSAIGNPNHWTATDFNDIWEKDSQPIVALHVGSGQDIQGRPGLYVFKKESTYRVNDSTTGAYETVDGSVGAASNIAVVGVGARIYVLSRRGVFMGQDGQIGLVNVSDKLAPLWDPLQVNVNQLDLWAAGHLGNRAFFSLTRAGSTANDLALELHTEQGWLAPHSNAMAAYATKKTTGELLYGGSPSVAGQTYQLQTTGADDGAAIAGWFQTRWQDLLGGYEASILHVRVRGRGTTTVEVRRDYRETGDQTDLVISDTAVLLYDSGLLYDTGLTYSVPSEEPTASVYPVGAFRQLSLKFSFSNTGTVSAPALMGGTALPQVGPFGVFLVEAMFMRLGIG